MKKQQRGRWQQSSMKLAPDHGWRARPGNRVFVIDRGAVRFDVPGEWTVNPKDASCVLKDPADNCQLEITHFVLPPVDMSGLPLVKMLQDGNLIAGQRTPVEQFVRHPRRDIEILWSEYTYIDPSEDREAIGRTCLARGNNVQVLISYAFWPEHRERFHAVWEEVLRTLQLGHYFADPRVGPRLH